MIEVRLKAYAKINIGLDVLRKRENGYHDVKMIMQTISLHDDVVISKINCEGISIKTNSDEIPTDKNNLVYKAVELLRKEFNIKQGVQIYINKNIPVAAGMAGGSSNCAAVLTGMNELFQLGLTMEDLMKRGVTLGADVPYCIMGGTALSEGIGEVLTPIAHMPECFILVAKPDISVSTAYVYQNLKINELKHPDIDGIIDSINENNLLGIADKMENVLESVTIDRHPVISQIKEKMCELGALKALMSGSGPSVFGIYEDKATVEKAYEYIKAWDKIKDIFITTPYK